MRMALWQLLPALTDKVKRNPNQITIISHGCDGKGILLKDTKRLRDLPDRRRRQSLDLQDSLQRLSWLGLLSLYAMY